MWHAAWDSVLNIQPLLKMLKNRETQIEMIVATDKGSIRPPCGRCREIMFQVDRKNLNTKVYLSEEKYVTLEALLPQRWEPSV